MSLVRLSSVRRSCCLRHSSKILHQSSTHASSKNLLLGQSYDQKQTLSNLSDRRHFSDLSSLAQSYASLSSGLFLKLATFPPTVFAQGEVVMFQWQWQLVGEGTLWVEVPYHGSTLKSIKMVLISTRICTMTLNKELTYLPRNGV